MHQPRYIMNRPSRCGCHRGATISEFIMVLPLLFFVFFAAFEFCRVSMVRHTADNAVYEGCRTAMRPGATSGEAEAEVRRVLATLGVNNANVVVSPTSIDRHTREVTVQVEVPLQKNSFVPNHFVAGGSLVRHLTMRRKDQ